jgi:hypothetical protein
LLNGWANGLGKQFKELVLVGATLCWVLWTSKNDMMFDNSTSKTFMQILYQGKYWLRQWGQLQKHEEHTQENNGSL